MSQATSSGPAASTHTGLLITLTIIAALGGLLFGYDSAVISGATDSIKQNFVAPMGLNEGARLSLEGFTIAGALWGCLIGGAIGVGLSLAIGGGVSALVPGLSFIYSPATIIAAFVSSTLIGVGFGFMPARSAARLDPVVALASE